MTANPGALRIEVLLFGRLREAAAERSIAVEMTEGATAAGVWSALEIGYGGLRGAARGVRVAVNEEYAAWETVLRHGDTVAFIPPVAGGVAAVDVRITEDPLDQRALEALVRTDRDGAVCTFSGVVRDHHEGRDVAHLEYEAYATMAEGMMRRIGEETIAATGATALALWHRVGALAVGETSVVVCASAPHRAEAFDACRNAIDRLKAEVPIWKKEHGPAGQVWVEDGPHPPSTAPPQGP